MRRTAPVCIYKDHGCGAGTSYDCDDFGGNYPVSIDSEAKIRHDRLVDSCRKRENMFYVPSHVDPIEDICEGDIYLETDLKCLLGLDTEEFGKYEELPSEPDITILLGDDILVTEIKGGKRKNAFNKAMWQLRCYADILDDFGSFGDVYGCAIFSEPTRKTYVETKPINYPLRGPVPYSIIDDGMP